MSIVITGLFESASQATLAIYRLEALSINEADISIVANDSYAKEDFAVDKGTKASEGGIIGAASGGILAAIGAFIPEHEIKYCEDVIE